MICEKCGRQNPDSAKFCDACGASLGAPDEVQPAAAPKKNRTARIAVLAAVAVLLAGTGTAALLLRDRGHGSTGTPESSEAGADEDEEEDEEASTEPGTEPETETEAPTGPETQAPTEPDYEAEYHAFLEAEVLPAHGLADLADAQVLMEDYGEASWLSPGGVYAAHIEDLDDDAVPEMVVFYTVQQTDESGDYYPLYADLYRMEDGAVEFVNALHVNPYFEQDTVTAPPDSTDDRWYDTAAMTENISENRYFYITAVRTEQGVYFVFEDNRASAFGDGGSGYYWAMRYTNGVLEPAFSFTQVAGGSCGFVFDEYYYQKEVGWASRCFWTDGSGMEDEACNPAYDGDFAEALTTELAEFGITAPLAETDNYTYFPSGGFAPDAPGTTRILEYLVDAQSYTDEGVDFLFTAEDYTGLHDEETVPDEPEEDKSRQMSITYCEDTCQAWWIDYELTTDYVFDGELLMLEFQIAEDAPDGNYPVELILADLANCDAQTLEAEIIQGSVAVGQGHPEAQSEPDGTFSLCVDTVRGRAGDTVCVAVRMCGNPGLVGLRLDVQYDPDVLTLVDAYDGKAFALALERAES